MNQYTQLKDKHHKMYNEFPFGVAFNNEQFVEMMEKWGLTPKDTDKIYKGPISGIFYQRKDAQRLRDMLDLMDKEEKEAIALDTTGEGYIYDMFRHELSNHEYCITFDLTDTLRACGLTIEEINSNPLLLHGLQKAKKDYLADMREAGWY